MTDHDNPPDFDPGDRVRIDWPGTELHGRTATVRNSTTIRETDGSYALGYGVTCDVPASNGQRSLIVRAAHLVLAPVPPSKVDELVDTWQRAADRYQRLDAPWPLVRWVTWPAALVAMVLLTAGHAAPVTAVLSVCALVFAFGYAELLRAADVASMRAWDAIRDYTGLSGDEVARLVGLDWDGDQDEEETR